MNSIRKSVDKETSNRDHSNMDIWGELQLISNGNQNVISIYSSSYIYLKKTEVATLRTLQHSTDLHLSKDLQDKYKTI